MKLIDTLLYSKTNFKFVSNHWDLHLEGLCIYNKKVCFFKTLDGDFNEDKDDWDESLCEIYSLSFKERCKWIWKQKTFEWMVGYHWTYPQRKNGRHFYYRKPVWLYKFLFKLFYKR